MYSIVGNKEESSKEEAEYENETSKLSDISVIEYYNYSNKKNKSNNCLKILLVAFITISIFCAFFFISVKLVNIIYNDKNNINFGKHGQNEKNKINISNEKEEGYLNNSIFKNDNYSIKENIHNSTKENETLINSQNNKELKNKEPTKKIGLAFLYKSLYANGISRFITLTANYLMKTGRYDICFITSNFYGKEYAYNNSIRRFIAFDNYTLIRNITKHENIDIFILQNVISSSVVNFYRSLGKKVIGMFHGVYMSAMAMGGSIIGYRNWMNFDLYDSFIFIVADDYYFYKKLGFKNAIYMPNLYTFEPSTIKNSNLTYNNIIMLGRQNDPIKGAKYAVKAMSYIVKEIPDAKLTLVTSDCRIQFLINLTVELNLTNNVFINYYTYNISSYFWNSSVHMYTSLSEAFPMAMNEGKAHGLPIVAFNVPYSPPYQDGVIVVDQLDVESLARETILLLKDYNYRKRMGEWAKKV